jgi:hypothetical protein
LLVYKEARPRVNTNNGDTIKELPMVNDFDLIGAAGIGFQIQLNETTMAVFEGTYLRGFTSVFNNQSIYHNGFSGTFALGILL